MKVEALLIVSLPLSQPLFRYKVKWNRMLNSKIMRAILVCLCLTLFCTSPKPLSLTCLYSIPCSPLFSRNMLERNVALINSYLKQKRCTFLFLVTFFLSPFATATHLIECSVDRCHYVHCYLSQKC